MKTYRNIAYRKIEKYSDLEEVKQQQQLLEDKQERLNIAMNALENQYQDELLNFSFDPENVQSMRNFYYNLLRSICIEGYALRLQSI